MKVTHFDTEVLQSRSELVGCLASGLEFLRGTADERAQKLQQRMLANIIIEHLNNSGYSISRTAAV